jgi:8-oxo-dGTP diphosphatase/2-hydroxy-dATP diphosphatase
MKKLLSLVLVTQADTVLLGMKKRGFGVGHWNGFGGKVEAGESIIEAARRELKEEVCLEVDVLEEVGVLEFSFASEPTVLEVHVFKANEIVGEPKETEEMKPQWFSIPDIPYDQMWPDDRYWLPLLLAGKKFKGTFRFDQPANGVIPVILHSELSEE